LAHKRASEPLLLSRYFVDENGKRILFDLTLTETIEFEQVDQRYECENGSISIVHDARWSELYTKHERGWKLWISNSLRTDVEQ
jgi:hypothetical protein